MMDEVRVREGVNEVRVHEPYVDAGQQREADIMGMYVFLATEIMLFGGLLAVILVVRLLHPHEVVEASKRLHLWIGALNTAVLLTSSLAVAAAVELARAGRGRAAGGWLGAAALAGAAFLGIKAFEYSREIAEGLLPVFSEPGHFEGPVHRLFMDLYLVATGLHALHVAVGILLIGGLGIRLAGGSARLAGRAAVVEVSGLYWHFVDIVWVFLYPALYLAR